MAHERGIVGRDQVPEGGDAVGRRPALLIDVFLDRDRHAVNHSADATCRQILIRPARLGERLVGVVVRDGVEMRVLRVDAADDRLHHFDRGERLAANAFGEIACAQLPQLVSHDGLFCDVISRPFQRSLV
jgi:hypothetical protein